MLKSIQLLRAISAWMVVFYHTQQIYFGFGESGLISVFFSRYGAMGVDIFFVISGFVIYISTINKNISPLQFMANRIIESSQHTGYFQLSRHYWLSILEI